MQSERGSNAHTDSSVARARHAIRWAYQNGQWVEADGLSLLLDDLAITHAVTAVERIRAYDGALFRLQDHLHRWQRTTSVLRLSSLPGREQLSSLIDQTIQKNAPWIEQQSGFGVLLVGSPGATPNGNQNGSTLIIDLYPIDEASMQRRIGDGTPIVVTDVMQPDPHCWPRDIKVRCRLHYYLADLAARQSDPAALGVLIDTDRSITETSLANIVIVEGGTLVSPPAGRILPGISLQVVKELADDLGIPWQEDVISTDRLKAAGEILLTGTSCGVWFANRVDGKATKDHRPIYQALRTAFDRII
ncbi:aminotransferase class IV [Roseiconus lacunae]|uniref:aminotransferase class IV n=1 Tax=Roseiconus lacunae TaxID=2605694 RepID=UPI001E59E0EF|nr:aminotransferase class IV [Roseiconus lacunae]MCD0462512.1 aminotransferase class IV [Roseiconus lacunae]